MHKISNFTGKIPTPSMGFGGQRQQHDLPPMPPAGVKHPRDLSSIPRQSAPRYIFLSFNIPFSSNLAGPDPEDILHATDGALARWTHSDQVGKDAPTHQLPVHIRNIENLRRLCRDISERSDGRLSAAIFSSDAKAIPGYQLAGKTLITNVCLSGDQEIVRSERTNIMNSTPISLRCTTIDVDQTILLSAAREGSPGIRGSVLVHMNSVARSTGADIFLLKPKRKDAECRSFTGNLLEDLDQKFRVAIYGTIDCAEHAKTRLLIMIDQILKRKVDVYRLELTMHALISGRLRKHIKHIESTTNTALYFPPPFPQVHCYTPSGAQRRRDDEVYISGEMDNDIYRAKAKLHDFVRTTQACMRDIRVPCDKIDNIMLDRLDQMREITEFNGSYILFPQLGLQHGMVKVQGTDLLHVERTIREIMTISGDYYAATWEVHSPEGLNQFAPWNDVPDRLAEICISSGAAISFDRERMAFDVFGSAGAVKSALYIIGLFPSVQGAESVLHVKIELANEHKEFVSGKKNGKINKIMTQSGVQVYFDMFNDYNFFIDICGASYDTAKSGLDLVEQEMPSSIDFHVPDQYHKRIIGVGGQHIQQIMKKHSVFVKFTNAMDRGGVSKEDADIKVNNVICRTPSRNVVNLDLVKQEIMGMVDRADSEIISEDVAVDRLYQRVLLGRIREVEDLEKKWNCKVNFPRTENAQDFVTITGPESQIPGIKDDFLGMVPKSHEISFKMNDDLSKYLASQEFKEGVVQQLKQQHEVELRINAPRPSSAASQSSNQAVERMTLYYTCNNTGGFEEAVELLTTKMLAHGLDKSTIQGAIPRPKSDSFDSHALFFPTMLLQPADTSASTDSPTRSAFSSEDTNDQRSFLAKLRSKPGGAISNFLGTRKVARSPTRIPNYPSNNVSKTSLVSFDSQGSSYRNPWNDSGVNLADGDTNGWPAQFVNNGNGSAGDLHRLHYAPSTVSLSGSSTALPPPGSSSGLPSGGTSISTPPTANTLFSGDLTPKHEITHPSYDSRRPSTSNSNNAPGFHQYASTTPHIPTPIGPPPRSSGS